MNSVQLEGLIKQKSPLRYTPAGIAVGLLTPLSVLAIRSSMAQHMDWEAAGTATALWRASDWVLSVAAGLLYYHHLPQLSRHVTEGRLASQLPVVLRQILWPSAVALVLLWSMQSWLLPLLYDQRMQVSPIASARQAMVLAVPMTLQVPTLATRALLTPAISSSSMVSERYMAQ